jgi:hypothetical protein
MTSNDSVDLNDRYPQCDRKVLACEEKHRNSPAHYKWFWWGVLCVSTVLLIIVLKA